MGDLQQFLDADPGGAEHFHDGPGPERGVFFQGQIAPPARGRVVCPPFRAGRMAGDRADQGLPGGGECLPGRGGASRAQQHVRVLAPLADGPDEHGQDRQALAGARVDAGLAVPGCLALVDLGRADRAPGHPRSPPGRVLGRPLRDVQVEGAHPGEAFTVVQPRDCDLGLLAGRGVCRRLRPGPPALLPAAGNLGGQLQGVDARVVLFEVLPEVPAERPCEGFQRDVVDHRLPFLQVIHQQVADRTAGQVVAVDHLLRRPLPGGAQFPERPRRGRVEVAGVPQQPVEHAGVAGRAGMEGSLGVQQFQDIACRDVADAAALGRDDERGPAQRARRHRAGCPRFFAQPPQVSEPRGVTCPGQAAGQGALAALGGNKPAQRGTDDVGADRHRQADAELTLAPADVLAAVAEPAAGQPAPSAARGVGSAARPPLLPGVSRLFLQPVQQRRQPAGAVALAAPVVQGEQRAGQQLPHLLPRGPGRRPVRCRRTRREACQG